jgi:hypothetical protein
LSASGLKLVSSRIWHAPFKLSNDPHFEAKVTDIIGLYLKPPDKAIVPCVDEKSQIQPLDRTQRGLPMKRAERQR